MGDARLAFVEAAKEIDVYVAEKTRSRSPAQVCQKQGERFQRSRKMENVPMPRRES